MDTYWQAEIYRHGKLCDCDFPRRESAADALSDAADRRGSMSRREVAECEFGAAEWREAGGISESTGNVRVLD